MDVWDLPIVGIELSVEGRMKGGCGKSSTTVGTVTRDKVGRAGAILYSIVQSSKTVKVQEVKRSRNTS